MDVFVGKTGEATEGPGGLLSGEVPAGSELAYEFEGEPADEAIFPLAL